MLRRPKTLRKYHEAEDTQEASRDTSSTPLCSIGLNLRVNGNGTLAGVNASIENQSIEALGRGPYWSRIPRRPSWSTLRWWSWGAHLSRFLSACRSLHWDQSWGWLLGQHASEFWSIPYPHCWRSGGASRKPVWAEIFHSPSVVWSEPGPDCGNTIKSNGTLKINKNQLRLMYLSWTCSNSTFFWLDMMREK